MIFSARLRSESAIGGKGAAKRNGNAVGTASGSYKYYDAEVEKVGNKGAYIGWRFCWS